jgi:hypothetical protein
MMAEQVDEFRHITMDPELMGQAPYSRGIRVNRNRDITARSPALARQAVSGCHTSWFMTRRPTMAAARCKLESAMSLLASSGRSSCVRLVFSSLGHGFFGIFFSFEPERTAGRQPL